MTDSDKPPFRGPRGGRTTRTSEGWQRKSFHLRPDEERAVRLYAAEHQLPESEVIRRMVREWFELGEPEDGLAKK